MTVSIQPGAPGETSVGLAFSGTVDGTLDLQFSVRPDFAFCVCPIVNVPAQNAVFTGLNHNTVYYVRARGRRASGLVEEFGPPAVFKTPVAAARDTAPAKIMIEPAMLVVPERGIVPFMDAVPGYPSTNLMRDDPTTWRQYPQADGVEYRTYFHAPATPIDTIALLNTNIPEGAAGAVFAGANLSEMNGSAFVMNLPRMRASRDLPGRPGYHCLIRLPAPVAYPMWSVRWRGPALPGGVLEVQHMIFGLNRVTKNHALEKVESASPLTTVDRRRSGGVDRVRGLPMRKVEFELQTLTEAQYETVYGDLWRHENEPVLVVPNSKEGAFLHDRILYGDLVGGRAVNASSPRYNRQFAVNSII